MPFLYLVGICAIAGASCYVEKKYGVEVPYTTLALKTYNEQLEMAVKSGKDMVVPTSHCNFSPCALKDALISAGFKIETKYDKEGDGCLTIDLSSLIQPYPHYFAERQLSAALFKVGLNLMPGEVNGWRVPGLFTFQSVSFTEKQIETIKERLLRVVETFKVDTAPQDPNKKQD